VLLRLAKDPPADVSALADVPGVGPALADRFGGTILRALSSDTAGKTQLQDDALLKSLTEWRVGIARQMGVPPFLVVSDAVVHAIASTRPQNRLDLARIRGVGPRTLAKFADELLSLSAQST
jgi:superfamily II DNA helicase RecQ